MRKKKVELKFVLTEIDDLHSHYCDLTKHMAFYLKDSGDKFEDIIVIGDYVDNEIIALSTENQNLAEAAGFIIAPPNIKSVRR